MNDNVVFHIKHSGKVIILDSLQLENTVLDIKSELERCTSILPENQKLIGLRSLTNKHVTDSTVLQELILKPVTKCMLIGSKTDDILKVNQISENTDVIDDFEFKVEDIKFYLLPENIDKIDRRSKSYRPRKIAEFREDKKLLVLDIDYTIFDHMTPAESAHQLARPYLVQFLTRAYVYYDIAIWSATSMTWILAKLGQIGIIPANVAKTFQYQSNSWNRHDGDPPRILNDASVDISEAPFRISLLLDSTDMISVDFPNIGVKDVKPLAVIWNNHTQWGPHNTIMFDDVRRNFIMNPQSGLRIRSYRDANMNFKHDHELLNLATYLELIALREPDFLKLDHNNWERYIKKYGRHYKYCLEQTYDCNFSTSPTSLNRPSVSNVILSGLNDSVTPTGGQKRLHGNDDDDVCASSDECAQSRNDDMEDDTSRHP